MEWVAIGRVNITATLHLLWEAHLFIAFITLFFDKFENKNTFSYCFPTVTGIEFGFGFLFNKINFFKSGLK